MKLKDLVAIKKVTSFIGLKGLIVILLLIFQLYSYNKTQREKMELHQQIYAMGTKTGKKVTIGRAPKKTFLEKVLRKKKLKRPVTVLTKLVEKVIEVQVDCPDVEIIWPSTGTIKGSTRTVTIVTLIDGTVMSEDSNVKDILVEDYKKPYGRAWGFRMGVGFLPNEPNIKRKVGLAFHWQTVHYRRMYLDTTVISDFKSPLFMGVGISYNPKFWALENTHLAIGHGFDFDGSHRRTYFTTTVKFGEK